MPTLTDRWVTPLLDVATESACKRQFYDSEVYYREGIADCLEVWPSDTMRHLSHISSAILKPEAVAGRMLEASLAFFARNGFRVVAATTLNIGRLMVRELWRYRFNIATVERLFVMDLLMSAAPSLYVVLDRAADEHGSATAALKDIKGPSAPDRREPHQLRHRLGRRSHLINYLHAPDEVADYVRELAILFDRETRQRILRLAAAGEDRMEDAARMAQALYRVVPEHDLCFDASLERIVAASGEGCGSKGDSRTVPTMIERITDGTSRDWRALFAALDDRGAVVPAWDRIVVLAELIEMNLPGREPLL